MLLLQLLSVPVLILQTILTHLIQFTVILSLCYGICYRLGIVQRLLQRHVELELSKISNGAQFTITSIEFQLSPFSNSSFFTTSTLSITDLIIHTPKKKEWQWDSPLIARVGKIDVCFNIFTIIEIPNFIHYVFNHAISSATSAQDPTPSSSETSRAPFVMKSSIKDIYTAQAYDVQVFIEKRGNVFNFHLLDDRLDIPNAHEVLERITGFNNVNNNNNDDDQSTSKGNGNGAHNYGVEDHNNHQAITVNDRLARDNMALSPLSCKSPVGTAIDDISKFRTPEEKNTGNRHGLGGGSSSGSSRSADSNSHDHHNDGIVDLAETKANEIVKSIVDVVSKLGTAAHEGGQSGLSVALQNQKDGFVSQLKKVKDLVGVKDNKGNSASTNGNESQSSGTKGNRSAVIAKEGIQVIKRVGKVVEKNVLTMKEKVISLSKPPPFKEGYKPPENPELFRIGFVELRDIRIFTKEIISSGTIANGSLMNTIINSNVLPSVDKKQQEEGDDLSKSTTRSSNELESVKPGSRSIATPTTKQQNLCMGVNNWSKPILVKEVRLHHSELCPSSYSLALLLKENNMTSIHSPSSSFDKAALIGLPIEQVSNIIMTKMLTESAKTNTGQLLTNAFSELFAWFNIEN